MYVDEYEEDGDERSSFMESEPSLQSASQTSSEGKQVLARPLRKSQAFHNHDLLQQQVRYMFLKIVELSK